MIRKKLSDDAQVREKQENLLAEIKAMSLSMVYFVEAATIVGYAIDRWLGTIPWASTIFFIFGIIFFLFTLYKRIQNPLSTGQQKNFKGE